MDYTLQIHGEKRVYPVPNGLYELLSDIVREVLRAQPAAIVPFISEYLQALVTTRELSKDAVEIVDSVLTSGEENIRLCLRLGISLDEANRAAATIQAAWRGYVVRKRFRKKKDFKEKRPPHFVDVEQQERERKLAEDLDQFLERKKITYLEALTAARIIQAAWKGYKERVLKKHGGSDESLMGWAHPWLKEFDKKPLENDEKPFPKAKLFPQRTSSLLYLPRRPIMANPQRLKALFHGQKEDYESLERSLSKLMAADAETTEAVEKEPEVPTESLAPYAFIPSKEEMADEERAIKPFLEAEELYQKIYGASEADGPAGLVPSPEFPWSADETLIESELRIKTAWGEEQDEEVEETLIEELPVFEEASPDEASPKMMLPKGSRTGIEPIDRSQPEFVATEQSQPELEEEEEEREQITDEAVPIAKEDYIYEASAAGAAGVPTEVNIPGGSVQIQGTDDEAELVTTDEEYATEYSENDTIEDQSEATTE